MPGIIKSATWSPHGYKHNCKVTIRWALIVKHTKGRPAKYLPEINNQVLESEALKRGTLIYEERDNGTVLFQARFYLCDKIIGASNGIETDIVWVEWNSSAGGIYHGYPISEQELLDELRHRRRKKVMYFYRIILRRWQKLWKGKT